MYTKSYYKAHTDHYFKKNLEGIPSFLWIKKELQVTYKDEVLDAGCGTGYLLDFVCGNTSATGVDISKEAVSISKELFPKHKFVQADLTQLPFKNEVFNKVFCFNVIEHVKDKEKAIKELKRVMRKDGTLIIGTNVKDSLSWRLFEVFFGGDPTHFDEFSEDEFIEFISKYFKIVKSERSSCIGRFPNIINYLLNKVLKADILVKAVKE